MTKTDMTSFDEFSRKVAEWDRRVANVQYRAEMGLAKVAELKQRADVVLIRADRLLGN